MIASTQRKTQPSQKFLVRNSQDVETRPGKERTMCSVVALYEENLISFWSAPAISLEQSLEIITAHEYSHK
jgi:hypothetical protein